MQRSDIIQPMVPLLHPIVPQEAWNAIQKKHPELPVMFFAAGDDKALAYAGVPQGLTAKISAGEPSPCCLLAG